jgi:hypothetical protein
MRRGAPVQVMVPFTPQGRVLFIRFPVVAVLAPGARRRRVAPRIASFMKSGVSAGGDRRGQRPPGRSGRPRRPPTRVDQTIAVAMTRAGPEHPHRVPGGESRKASLEAWAESNPDTMAAPGLQGTSGKLRKEYVNHACTERPSPSYGTAAHRLRERVAGPPRGVPPVSLHGGLVLPSRFTTRRLFSAPATTARASRSRGREGVPATPDGRLRSDPARQGDHDLGTTCHGSGRRAGVPPPGAAPDPRPPPTPRSLRNCA